MRPAGSHEGPRLGFLLAVPLDVSELWIQGGVQETAVTIAPAGNPRRADGEWGVVFTGLPSQVCADFVGFHTEQ